MSKVYVGDIGTVISINTGIDISTSTVRRIRYRKPDGIAKSWPGTLAADNQTLYYTTQEGDLDSPGTWKLQGYIKSPSWSGLSETINLVVNKRFG